MGTRAKFCTPGAHYLLSLTASDELSLGGSSSVCRERKPEAHASDRDQPTDAEHLFLVAYILSIDLCARKIALTDDSILSS